MANSGLSDRAMQYLNKDDASKHLLRTARGLNPGIAFGYIEVVEDIELSQIKAARIYLFSKAPQDLKPVAGLLSVTEGNPISHIQLLARNLGIPNGVITQE